MIFVSWNLGMSVYVCVCLGKLISLHVCPVHICIFARKHMWSRYFWLSVISTMILWCLCCYKILDYSPAWLACSGKTVGAHWRAHALPAHATAALQPEPELKGSIGEGPNHSNHSNHSNSYKIGILPKKFKNFRKFQHFLIYRRNSDKISSKSEQKSVKRIQK